MGFPIGFSSSSISDMGIRISSTLARLVLDSGVERPRATDSLVASRPTCGRNADGFDGFGQQSSVGKGL